jgi:hypothetical protein
MIRTCSRIISSDEAIFNMKSSEDVLLLKDQRPWSMITGNRIFSRNFAVYGRLP